MRRQLRIILIATILWLPLQANGKSVFVGIDGCVHTSAEIDALFTSEHELSSIGALITRRLHLFTLMASSGSHVKKFATKGVSWQIRQILRRVRMRGLAMAPIQSGQLGLLCLDNDFAVTFDRIAL